MQTPMILSGLGSLDRLKEELSGSTLLVSDRGLEAAGLLEEVAGRLDVDSSLAFLDGEPSAQDVDRLAAVLRDSSPTVIGLGGGSALDLAKLAAAVASGPQGADVYGECKTPLPGKLRTILIPTTAGTGSEMTRTAVFTNSQGRKTWAWGNELQADIAVLDPELTVGLPLAPTVFTAVDALSHALEAATGRGKTELTRQLAKRAVAMLPDALSRAMTNLSDLKAREDLLNASGLAGIVLNSGGTGLAHALAHALGTLAKVPHGLAIAWSLPLTIKWNGNDCYSEFSWLAGDSYESITGWLDSLPLAPIEAVGSEELAEVLRYPENRVILDNNPRPVLDDDIPGLCREFTAFCEGRLSKSSS